MTQMRCRAPSYIFTRVLAVRNNQQDFPDNIPVSPHISSIVKDENRRGHLKYPRLSLWIAFINWTPETRRS